MNRLDHLRRLVSGLYAEKNPNRANWADWLYENHIFLVADAAFELATRFHADPELCAAAGMLHDIADATMSRFDPLHETRSNEIAIQLLRVAGFSEYDIEIIVYDAMKYHGCHDGKFPQTPEGRVVATADAVTHLTTDFYMFGARKLQEEKGDDAVKNWAVPKIERDMYRKIFFDEVREEVRPYYEKLKEYFQ